MPISAISRIASVVSTHPQQTGSQQHPGDQFTDHRRRLQARDQFGEYPRRQQDNKQGKKNVVGFHFRFRIQYYASTGLLTR